MAAHLSLSSLLRPGVDIHNPHQDLYIPPDRLARSLAADPRRLASDAATVTGTATPGLYNSSSTSTQTQPQSHFGSVDFWTRREQTEVERSAPQQAASIHRAAEVARWEWIQIHKSTLERERASHFIQQHHDHHSNHAGYTSLPSTSTSTAPPRLMPRPIPWRQRQSHEAASIDSASLSVPSPSSPRDTTAIGRAVDRLQDVQAHIAGQSASLRPWYDDPFAAAHLDLTASYGTHPSTSQIPNASAPSSTLGSRLTRPLLDRSNLPRLTNGSRFSASAGSLLDDLTAWNNLCRDLAIAAGISPDEDEAEGEPIGGNSTSSTSSRGILPFGIDAGPRGLPHPIWGRRYFGPAGGWLRAELLARGRDMASSAGGAEGVTPASALANEWRATTAGTGRPIRGNLVRDTTAAALLSEPTNIERQRTVVPQLTVSSGESTSTTLVAPNRTSTFGLPATTLASSLTDPWTATRLRNDENAPTLEDQSSVNQMPSGPIAIGTGRAAQSTLPNRPSSGLMPARHQENNEPLPDIAFEVPPEASSQPQRSAAADEVTRMAHISRTMREHRRRSRQARPAAAEIPSEGSESRQASSLDVEPGTTTRGQRVSDSNGMRTLLRLRGLDGLEVEGEEQRAARRSVRQQTHEPFGDGNEPDQGTRPAHEPAPYELFPWYSPPSDQIQRGPSTASRQDAPISRDFSGPDDDTSGQNEHRTDRAQLGTSSQQSSPLNALEDPNGERIHHEDSVSSRNGDHHREGSARRGGQRSRGASEAEEEGAARRQRNRTALVIAGRDEQISQGLNPWLSPIDAATSRPLTEGWTLVNPTMVGSPVAAPQSPFRPTRDEGSENVTTWFRGSARIPSLSTSPGPIEAVSETSREGDSRPSNLSVRPLHPDPRAVRRPQRLRSLNEGDLVGAGARLIEADDEEHPDAQPQQIQGSYSPRPIPTWASPARRAQFWRSGQVSAVDSDHVVERTASALSSAPDVSVFDMHRNTPMDELRARASSLWHASQHFHSRAADVAERLLQRVNDAEADSMREQREASRQNGSEAPPLRTSVAARMLSSPATDLGRMADVSSSLEAELREREANLTASSARLAEELTRRRARIDELRQREGRIGRVLNSSEAALRRLQERAPSSVSNDMSTSAGLNVVAHSSAADIHGQTSLVADDVSAAAPPDQSTLPPFAANGSLIRRRTLRDSAPQMRGPRAPRGGFSYLEYPPDSARIASVPSQSLLPASQTLRRSLSSSSIGRLSLPEGIIKDDEQLRSDAGRSRTPSPRRSLDDSVLVLPRTAETSLLNHSPLRSLVTPEDQARLGRMSTLILEAIDAIGHPSYRKAVLEAHRRTLETWAPAQTPLPTSTMEVAYPLRFEMCRHVGSEATSRMHEGPSNQPASMSTARPRNVLLNDESSIRFNADQGTEMVLRFLSALPPSSAAPSNTRHAPMSPAQDVATAADSPAGPSVSRAEAVDTWTVARPRATVTGSADQVGRSAVPADELNVTSPPTASLSTSDSGLDGVRASRLSPSSNARSSVQSELTDRETSVIRHILALRNLASTVAERVAQLSNLSHDDVDVIRGLARRAYIQRPLTDSAFDAGTSMTVRNSTMAGQQQQSSASSSPTAAVSGEISRPAAEAAAISSALELDLFPSRHSRPSLPALLPTEAVALTTEQVRLMRGFYAEAYPVSNSLPTSDAQLLSLITKDRLDGFIALRAQSISQAVTNTVRGEVPQPLGPVFSLSSLVIKIREAPSHVQIHSRCARTSGDAVDVGSCASLPAPASTPRNSDKIVHALIFFSVEPIRREQLAEWDGTSKTDVMCYLRTLKRQRYARIAGNDVDDGKASDDNRRLEHWEIDAMGKAAEEDCDLGDPFAVARRREEMRRADEKGVQRLMLATASSEAGQGTSSSSITADSGGSSDSSGGSSADGDSIHRRLPRLRPAAVVPIDLSKGGAVVNLEHEGLRTYGSDRQRRHRPIGRYLAIKILPGDGEGVKAAEVASGEGSEGEVLGAVVAPSRSIDLFYIGVKGWPAEGTGSLDGRWHD